MFSLPSCSSNKISLIAAITLLLLSAKAMATDYLEGSTGSVGLPPYEWLEAYEWWASPHYGWLNMPDCTPGNNDPRCGVSGRINAHLESGDLQLPSPGAETSSYPGDGGAAVPGVPSPSSPQGPTASGSSAPPMVNASGNRMKASRLFAGPSQYPPDQFAAYGIVAFPSRASATTRDRHLMICKAYLASLPHTSELDDIPTQEQMATVWPVTSAAAFDEQSPVAESEVCEWAVDEYGLVTGLDALLEAGIALKENLNRRGPYLLAWSPSSQKGEPDAIVLAVDLTGITTYRQANDVFVKWRNEIQLDSDQWEDGWNVEQVRLTIQQWVDDIGPRLFTLFY